MTRLVSSVLAFAIIALLLSPVGFQGSAGISLSKDAITAAPPPAPVLSGVVFPTPIDTSSTVPEYTMVSRALMLPGGSSDVVLDDLNDDGRTDLIVSAYEALAISVFYRQTDGTFRTYPSLNITTMYNPVSVRTADIYASGHHQIVALEKNPAFSDTRLAVYNLTSETTYERWPDQRTYSNGVSFTIGELSGDLYADLAVVCEGSNPQTNPGRLEVFFGPDFSTFELLTVGRGARSIAAADFNDDSLLEIAVGNYYDGNVMLFERPFMSGTPPTLTLAVDSSPIALVAGRLDGDSLADLAVATSAADAIRFYIQSAGGLPSSEDMNISVPHTPSSMHLGDMNADGRQDMVVLSQSANRSLGYYQGGAPPIWEPNPQFMFPTGGMPRAAVIAELDGDGLVDISVAASAHDWKGSSLSLYPSRFPSFSNSNSTTWTREGVTASMLETGDFNGDDVIDLVLLNEDDNSIDFFPSFGPAHITIPLGFSPGKLVAADFDRDGLSDMVVSMRQGPSIDVFFGSSTFPDQPVLLSATGSVTDAELGDFNDDSYPDFVVSTGEGKLGFYFYNQSTASFDSAYEISPSGGAGIWAIASGDFNSDGLEDIAYTRPIRKIAVMLQDPEIPFGPSSPALTLSHNEGTDFTSIWCGDLNGDGRDDIAAMRPFDPRLYLFDQNDFQAAPYPYGTLTLPASPKFLSVLDATDDGPADVVAIFNDASLLFLYRQDSGAFPVSPSMAFLAGADSVFASIGDGTQDHRGDMLVLSRGSRCVSVWQQLNFPPIAHSGGPYFAREGDPLRFNGSATTGTSEIPYMEYYWNFGDGNETGWIREPRPVHTYLAIGNYTISVEVRDPAGLLSSDYSYVIVEDSYPHVSFSWSPTEVSEGQLVTLTDETTSFDPVVSRQWSIDGVPFGDAPVVSVEFQNGTHEVSLNVTDSDGTSIELTKSIEVASAPPTLTILAPTEAIEGVPVVFVVLVDEWHGGPVDPIVSYEWDFSYVEGNFVPDPTAPNNNTASHVFSATSYWKLYRVAVRVVDSDGMVGNKTWDIRIFDSRPSAGLVINTTDPREGIPLVFVSTSSSYDGIVNWTWRLEHPNGSQELFWLDDRAMVYREFDYLDDGDYVMHLTVREADGNTSTYDLPFHVRELPPIVTLMAEEIPGMEGYYREFSKVNFTCLVEGMDPGVLWEWDFDSPGAVFVPDSTTTIGFVSHVYTQIGVFTVKVRAYDSDGSMAEESIEIEVVQKPLSCEMYTDIGVIRVAPNTENVTFNVTKLLTKHPDIVSLMFEFGDGTVRQFSNPPFQDVRHTYAIGRDYRINVTITDDDGYSFVCKSTIYVDPPEIVLMDPFDGAVVRSGATMLFLVAAGSTPVRIVVYDVNDEGFRPFSTQYIINTTGWIDADYRIAVIAWDQGGNVAILRYVRISIDDYPPVAVLYTEKTKVYAGSKFTITVWVADRNVVAAGVTLFVMFPGDRAFLAYPVVEGNDGNFYREFDAPSSKGRIDFFVQVEDLAGNSAVSELYSLYVRIPFLDYAWPYLLTTSLIGVLGLGSYLVREAKIAVDETFVIHNDGRMISHSTRRLKPSMDDQVLSGMFTAIQDFVRESFKDITSFTLRKIEFGEKSVLIEKGRNVYLAVILHGYASRKVAAKMQRAIDDIESKFGAHLSGWDGDLEKLRGINEITKKIYSKAPMLPWPFAKD